jgi:signal peptidase I
MGNESQKEPGWLQRALVGRNPSVTLLRIFILISVTFVVFRFVLLPIRVEGISMLPTYKDGTINFINRLSYARHEPQRGDIVGIRYSGTSALLLKRIIALPGETLSFQEGRAYINGQLLDEPYLKRRCDWTIPPETIGPDKYYVVGDNRAMPHLDHTKGQAARERIIGKVVL